MNHILFTGSTFLILTTTAFSTDSVSAVPPAQASEQEAPKQALLLENSSRSGNTVYFRFSDAVTKEDFDKSLSVEPALKVETTQQYSSGFSVHADFEPGETYAIRIAPSLAGTKTKSLGQEAVFTFIAPNRSTEINFLTNGSLFPLSAPDFSLPVQACNSEKIVVTVRQAYADSVIPFLFTSGTRNYSQEIFSGEARPKMRPNQRERYAIDLEKIGIPRKPGVYEIEAEAKHGNMYYTPWSSRIVVVTDLAIQAVRNGDELAVAVKTISENTAVPAKISVYSSKNRLIAKAQCDAEGFAEIAIPPLSDSEDSACSILAEYGEDKSVLRLDDLSTQRQKYGFEKHGAKAHVFPERGICRPGEEISLFANLRNGEDKRAQGNVPAEFHIKDPSGNSLTRIPVVGDEFGFYKTSVKIPDFAATGTYHADLRIPGQEESTFGSTRFSVGEYVPDTLAVSLKTQKDGIGIRARGNAAYYFGMPLDGGKIQVSLSLSHTRFVAKDENLKDFLFGLPGKEFADGISKSDKNLVSDAQGNFETFFELPSSVSYAAPILANVTASAASSAGGRNVSAGDSTEIHTEKFYLGTREKSVGEKERVFEIRTVAPDSSNISLAGTRLKATLTRSEWNYVVRETNGRTSYNWQEEHVPVGEFEFDASAETIRVPVPNGGNYTLTIALADGEKNILHKREFWHYYGETGSRSRNTAQLSFRLDNKKYLPGETAKIAFDSPFSGKAVLLIGESRIETMQTLDVRVGENVFEIPIPAGTNSGSRFFSVTASGKTEAGSPDLIQRTFGVGVIPVDQDARKIFVKTDLPGIIRPGEKAKIRVSLSDATGKPVAGKIQLWAVDRGVLALSGFKTPNPFSYFFGTYDCPYEFGDNYTNFYPLLSLDKRLFGGGAGTNRSKFLDTTDQSEKSAVVVLETLNVPASGEATAEITPPDFDGGMRLMAFALNEEKVGSGEIDFIVREPVAIQLTAPRAIAPGDEFELVAEIFNTDLPKQNFSWELIYDGKQVAAGGGISLNRNEKYALRKRLTAESDCATQTAELLVRDESGNLCSREDVCVSVRSPFPQRDNVVISELAPGSEAHFENANPAGEVSLGSPALTIAGALQWLENYPYGCLEQVSAATFPLLAASSLAEKGAIPAAFAESAATKIRGGLAQIATMRCYDGAYAMWPNGRTVWEAGSLFAWHLELEADASGFPLSEKRQNEIRKNLMRFADSAKKPIAQRAYAIYLLALAGEPRAAAFAKLFLFGKKGDDFSRFLVAAALVESGYAAEGMKNLLPLLEKDFWSEEKSHWDSCLDSPIRRAGFALHVLSKIAPDAPANKMIAHYLCKKIRDDGHWGSTQKNAWASFGLAAYFGKSAAGAERGILKIDGVETELKGSMRIPGGKRVSLKNIGERPILCFVRSREKAKSFEPIANGFEISRSYLDATGTSVTSCKTGDLLTVKIRVRAKENVPSSVICDLLPGGLEIEDETLLTRVRSNNSIPTQAAGFFELMRERRFDRFLAFGTFYPGDNWHELTYRVRATARGKFVIPPIQIESMYEGEKRATWMPENTIFEVR